MKVLLTTLTIACAQYAISATPEEALENFITATEKSDWVAVLHATERAWLVEYGIHLERPETVHKVNQHWKTKGITKSFKLTGQPEKTELNSYTIWIYPCEIHSAAQNSEENSIGFISATLHTGSTNWVFLDSSLVGDSEFRNIYSEFPTNQLLPKIGMIGKQKVQPEHGAYAENAD